MGDFLKNCILIEPKILNLIPWHKAYAKAFEKLSFKAHLVTNDENFISQIENVLDNDTKFFFTIDGVGSTAKLQNSELIYDYLNIPIISTYTDHPEQYTRLISESSNYVYSGFFDEGDIAYSKKYILNDANYFFHTDFGLCDESLRVPTFEERDLDIMFCGTIPDPGYFRSLFENINMPYSINFCNEIIEMLKSSDQISLPDAFESVLSSKNLFLDSLSLKNVHSLMSTLSHYIRGCRRIDLFKSLTEQNLKINFFGFEKDYNLIANENVTYCGFLRGENYWDALRRSKITLNSSPLSKYALSERQPTSMLNGALVVTDTNPYMDLYYKDGRDVISYNHNDYSHLADNLKEVLNSKALFEKITNNALLITKNNHTVNHRAQSILDVLRQGGAL